MTFSQHSTTAAAITADGTRVPLDVKSAQVTLDESWSPYCQATVVCAVPTGIDLSDVDPRVGTRVRVRLGQRFNGAPTLADSLSAIYGVGSQTLDTVSTDYAGQQVRSISADYGQPWNADGIRASNWRRFDLGLRRRDVDPVTGEVTLMLASDEALAQDYSLLLPGAVDPGSTSVRDVCTWALRYIGATLVDGDTDGTVTADSTVWEPGTPLWDYLEPLVAASGLRLWCDEHRSWRLTDPADGSSGGLTLTPVLKGVIDTISREGSDLAWWDGVVVRYRWVDATGATQTAYDVAGDVNASRVYVTEYQTPYPGPGAAAAILKRAQGRGRVLNASAVASYDVEPGVALTVTTPTAPTTQTGLVSSVTWQQPEDVMQIKTRDLIDTPPTAWLFTPAGVRWADVTAGIDWTEYAA